MKESEEGKSGLQMLDRGPREKGKVEKRWTKGGLDVSAMIRFYQFSCVIMLGKRQYKSLSGLLYR